MKYIALLRGINISGKNKIAMNELKNALKRFNYENIKTHLNSGNIIFESDTFDKSLIITNIRSLIAEQFHLDLPIYVLTASELENIIDHHPVWWGTCNKEIYDNIIFPISPTTSSEVIKIVGEPKIHIDQIAEYNNIIFWSYDINNYRKSNWWIKTANKAICNQITIRTANTMKKILEIINDF